MNKCSTSEAGVHSAINDAMSSALGGVMRSWAPSDSLMTAEPRRQTSCRSVADAEHTPRPLHIDACCICLARDRTHALAPCFHMCVCAACVRNMLEVIRGVPWLIVE